MEIDFQPSPFFSEQLTAFELWLEHGSKNKKPPEQLPIVLQARLFPTKPSLVQTPRCCEKPLAGGSYLWSHLLADAHKQASRKKNLPGYHASWRQDTHSRCCPRQVLLSQVHRLRALKLLGSFLDMGPWAVDLALSVGIFPYVLKLLQTTATDLRETLVFIWTKILALDRSCQVHRTACFGEASAVCHIPASLFVGG